VLLILELGCEGDNFHSLPTPFFEDGLTPKVFQSIIKSDPELLNIVLDLLKAFSIMFYIRNI
jgi:hypothetical protein